MLSGIGRVNVTIQRMSLGNVLHRIDKPKNFSLKRV